MLIELIKPINQLKKSPKPIVLYLSNINEKLWMIKSSHLIFSSYNKFITLCDVPNKTVAIIRTHHKSRRSRCKR